MIQFDYIYISTIFSNELINYQLVHHYISTNITLEFSIEHHLPANSTTFKGHGFIPISLPGSSCSTEGEAKWCSRGVLGGGRERFIMENNLQQEAESFPVPNHFPNFVIHVSIHYMLLFFPPLPIYFQLTPTRWASTSYTCSYNSYKSGSNPSYPIYSRSFIGPPPQPAMYNWWWGHSHKAAPAEAAPPKGLKRKALQAEPPKAKPMPLKRHAEAEMAEVPPVRPSTKVVRAAKTQARKPSRTWVDGDSCIYMYKTYWQFSI